MGEVVLCEGVCSVARLCWYVKLVSYSSQNVVIGALDNHRSIEVFLGN